MQSYPIEKDDLGYHPFKEKSYFVLLTNRTVTPMKFLATALLLIFILPFKGYSQTEIWSKWELSLTSKKSYQNPLYELKEFYAFFSSPSGREVKINGFWDGENQFKIRFAPDETGQWTYRTVCSDKENTGLHGQTGTFNCLPSASKYHIFKKGAIKRSKGNYHLSYADGTPFFYTACTAWNGALKSTEEEWDTYLKQRVDNHYSVIQFVTTQWRGCEKDRNGEVAFTGSGRVELNPAFFQRMDKKIDRINEFGLVAAPVLLWALPFSDGREFSPGYYLPQEEAILLAKYMVARFGANQVIWILGGDGRYVKEYEQRWKNIGRGVFGEPHPGLVAQHPHGSSWIGEDYKDEEWLDIIGYQSSHNKSEWVINWINKGPMAKTWDMLPARPVMNLEPNYEEIFYKFTDEDVRNASYWSLFATPISGITYGANGIWPWIQKEGELIENHGRQGDKGPSTWRKSIDFPGSIQIGYLTAFFQQFEWWNLRPAPELLAEQPGDSIFNHFISVIASENQKTILAYTPRKQNVQLRNSRNLKYVARWFDPVANKYQEAHPEKRDNTLVFMPPFEQDFVLVLEVGK